MKNKFSIRILVCSAFSSFVGCTDFKVLPLEAPGRHVIGTESSATLLTSQNTNTQSSQLSEVLRLSHVDDVYNSQSPPIAHPSRVESNGSYQIIKATDAVPTSWYSHKVCNDFRNIEWGDTYLLEGLLLNYQRTLSTEYLNAFIVLGDKVLACRDDRRTLRRTAKRTWSSIDSTQNMEPVATAGEVGLILRPFVQFALQVRSNPNLSMFSAKAGQYISEVESVVSDLAPDWRSEGGYGVSSTTQSYLFDSRGRSMSSLGILPFNLSHAMGSVHAGLFTLTNDPVHLAKARAQLVFFRQFISVDANGAWTWPYWHIDRQGPIDDTAHAYLTVRFLQDMFEAGAGVTKADLNTVGLTIERNLIYSQRSDLADFQIAFDVAGIPDFNPYFEYVSSQIQETGSDPRRSLYYALPLYSCFSASTRRLIPLAELLLSSVGTDRTYTYYGAAMTAFFKNRDQGTTNYLGACSAHTSCRTGLCNGLRSNGSGICNYPLNSNSTCGGHNECASGLCNITTHKCQ